MPATAHAAVIHYDPAHDGLKSALGEVLEANNGHDNPAHYRVYKPAAGAGGSRHKGVAYVWIDPERDNATASDALGEDRVAELLELARDGVTAQGSQALTRTAATHQDDPDGEPASHVLAVALSLDLDNKDALAAALSAATAANDEAGKPLRFSIYQAEAEHHRLVLFPLDSLSDIEAGGKLDTPLLSDAGELVAAAGEGVKLVWAQALQYVPELSNP